MSHRAVATIDRKALAHNLAVARRHAPESKLAAIIKADAYGHGLVPCAEALHDADLFGVTTVDEAEQLRRAGTSKNILVMQGFIDKADLRRIAHHNLQLVVHRAEDLAMLENEFCKIAPTKPLTFWLKVDTGMGRLGIKPTEVERVHLALRRQPWCHDVVVMTHLANAATPHSPLNSQQLLQFARSCQPLTEFAPETSIAASAAMLSLDNAGDWARPGIMLYGSSPFAWSDSERRRDQFDLHNVMTLKAQLISVRQHEAGDSIGYNSQFICPRAMRVGIVSIGYADGYPVTAANGTPVVVGNTRTGTVGRVSMDMLTIDLTQCPHARVGDLVTLWGDALPVDEVAASLGIISYQLLAGLGGRVLREYC